MIAFALGLVVGVALTLGVLVWFYSRAAAYIEQEWTGI